MTDHSTTIYRCTPRETRRNIVRVLESGRVPNIIGSPGIGKSALLRSVAKEFGMYLIDHRVSTSAPEDFTGLPEFYTNADGLRSARFVPFTEILPIQGMKVPDGYEGWLLFLDEFNSGTKMVQAAAYKTILDHMTGQHKLHERLMKACAGNLMSDRAITEELSTAMQSRLVHIEMEISHLEWLEDVALPEEYDERIVAYLGYNKEELMDFKPDHDDKTFNCPRTWEFMNDMIKGKEIDFEKDVKLFAGTVSSGSAVSFVAFCQVFKELLKIEDILRDPHGAEVPHEANKKWMITTHLMRRVDEKTFSDVADYMNRMDLSFRVVFYRGLMSQQPKLRGHPVFAKAMTNISDYLSGKKKAPATPTGTVIKP